MRESQPRNRAKANRKTPPASSPLQKNAPSASGNRNTIWICIGLIAVNLFIYAGVWSFDFVNYDDPGYFDNSYVGAGLTWQGVSWALRTGSMYNWHPLTWLSYMLDVQLFGLHPAVLHTTNLLIHIANTLLLFIVLYQMTGMAGRSSFVAAMFAAHPLHVESVAWISERKDVLSTLFWMLTLLAYVWYVRQPRANRYLLLFGCLALGLMAKPMLVTLPFVLLLLDFWPLRRWQPGEKSTSAVRLVVEKVPLVALSAASSVVTFMVQKESGAVARLDLFPMSQRLQNMFIAYAEYIGKMLWPSRLSAFYVYYSEMPAWWTIAALALIIVSVLAIKAAGKYPFVPVGWFWYLGTLVPVIGLVQVGLQSMADRYTYVPSIGLFIVVAWGLPEISAIRPYRNTLLPPAAGLALFLCAVTARAQTQYWSNTQVLWDHALEVTSNNYVAQNNLGGFLKEIGKPADALPHYQEAVRLKPDYADAHNNMGTVLAALGKPEQAIESYNEALRLDPELAAGHQNLGIAMENLGRLDEARAHLSEAIRLKPDFANAHNGLASLFFRQGKIDEAIAEYSEAVRLRPDFSDAHSNLGAALLRKDRIDEAVGHFSAALRINPNLPDAHYNLGVVYSVQGKVAEAVREFSEVLRINPSRSDAAQMLDQLQRRN
jgi:protein O-mannosyl-transferase